MTTMVQVVYCRIVYRLLQFCSTLYTPAKEGADAMIVFRLVIKNVILSFAEQATKLD